MMNGNILLFFGLLCALCFNLSRGKTIQSTYNLYNDLLANYTSDIRPVDDDTDILNVTTTLYLTGILELDEPRGQLTSALSMTLMWKDILLTWNPADYELRNKIEISKKHIWTPELMLISPSQSAEKLGKDSDKVLIYSYGAGTGFLSLTIIDIFYTICDIEVTYFPFDTQICEIRFSQYDYADKIRYVILENAMNTDFFLENGVWNVEKTELFTENRNNFNYDVVGRIHMKRRSTYYSLNLLGPILILMLLNCMVFLLPAESGERVGFAVTILLAIAVYMTIIADKLPNTSKPVSVLTFILVIYMAQSSMICVCTIFGLRIVFRDEKTPVSKTWNIFVRIMKCCRSRVAHEHNDHLASSEETKVKSEHDQGITWKTVAEMYDTLVLAINIVICILVAIVYFGIVLSNT
ncbi:hypothetical protein FSP39_011397 [Pinctada imbricata]|uniref:Uncharacterized protein n=1 Tax=Pinctada imbricata TaxID=66713 RepID=A0AA88YCC8_PINIB|nr:hypothetical protein FSP39_011397 [Pinctada imbricata]